MATPLLTREDGTTFLTREDGTTPLRMDGTFFEDGIQALIDGFVSAQSEAAGWNAVRSNIPTTAVARTSNTVATLTIPALALSITANETITATIPGAILTLGAPIVATPTMVITNEAAGGSVIPVLARQYRARRAA